VSRKKFRRQGTTSVVSIGDLFLICADFSPRSALNP
jgi:hypothetical protein